MNRFTQQFSNISRDVDLKPRPYSHSALRTEIEETRVSCHPRVIRSVAALQSRRVLAHAFLGVTLVWLLTLLGSAQTTRVWLMRSMQARRPIDRKAT